MGSTATTTLHTVNPSGSVVEVVRDVYYHTTYDANDRATTHERSTYGVRIDGQRMDVLSQSFLYSLYSTLKRRVENDPAYRKRLEDEARDREEAKSAAEAKARTDLYGKL